MKTITMGRYQLPSTVFPYREKPKWVDWEWYVLHEGPKATLVLSKDVIATDFFSGKNKLTEEAIPSTYEESYIRELLAEFFNDNFTFEEKCRILTNDLGDHLFLLSPDEVRKYLRTPESRIGEIRWVDEDAGIEKSEWWVNAYGAEDNMIQYVDKQGEIYEEGIHNDADEIGIRPAMWICNDAPAVKISRFREQRKVYIFPRMVGPDDEIVRHARACCRYAENAGRIPVLDPKLYPQVMRHMADNELPLSVYYAAGTPLEDCEDIWVFTQFPAAEIKAAGRRAKILGIPVMDMVGVRLPA